MAIEKILTDLLQEEARLDSELRKIRAAIAGLRPEAPALSTRRGRQPTFIPAVLKLLRQGDGQLLTTQEIVDQLKASGFSMDAQDHYRNAAAMLRRESSRPDARIAKINDAWMAV